MPSSSPEWFTSKSGNGSPDQIPCSLSPSNVDVRQSRPTSQLPACMAVHEGRRTSSGENWQPCKFAGLLDEALARIYPHTEASALRNAFFSASDRPPITTQSLGELDTPNIIKNIRLRHDLNFDLVCNFRPNLDGPRGAKKRKMMEQYWDALVAELSLYSRLFNDHPQLGHRDACWSNVVAQAERRIPLMFDTIRDVLKSLVPEPDHQRIDDILDGQLLMQQVERGVVSDSTLVCLAEWLNHFLKKHCAPIRDALLDRMVEEIRGAVAHQDLRRLINGLCHLMEILEAMKLVCADRQLGVFY